MVKELFPWSTSNATQNQIITHGNPGFSFQMKNIWHIRKIFLARKADEEARQKQIENDRIHAENLALQMSKKVKIEPV